MSSVRRKLLFDWRSIFSYNFLSTMGLIVYFFMVMKKEVIDKDAETT
jgi:hypothetical protein